MNCPKCKSPMVKVGKKYTTSGVKQRWQCRKGHIIVKGRA